MADLFDIAVARKLSGGGGGTTVEALSVTQNGTYTAPSGKAYSPVTVNVSGGSSDFSTAQVVITDNTEYVEHTFVNLFNISDLEGELEAGYDITGPSQRTATAVLYNNYLSAYIETSDNITVTGNIEYDSEYGDLYITGDGTITIS